MSKNKFLDLIKEQRSKKTKEKFKGSFLDYLSLIEDNPEACDLSHRRLYKSIIKEETNNKLDGCHRCVMMVHMTDHLRQCYVWFQLMMDTSNARVATS